MHSFTTQHRGCLSGATASHTPAARQRGNLDQRMAPTTAASSIPCTAHSPACPSAAAPQPRPHRSPKLSASATGNPKQAAHERRHHSGLLCPALQAATKSPALPSGRAGGWAEAEPPSRAKTRMPDRPRPPSPCSALPRPLQLHGGTFNLERQGLRLIRLGLGRPHHARASRQGDAAPLQAAGQPGQLEPRGGQRHH
jgi:hypothetical protein